MNSSRSDQRLDGVRRTSAWLSAWTEAMARATTMPLLLFLVIVPTIEAHNGRNQSAIVIASVTAAALLFTRLPDVVEFSLWGVRGKLEKAVREAEVTIKQLREIALAFAEASLSDLAAVGTILKPVTIADKFRIRDAIIASLEGLNVQSDEIAKAQRGWTSTYCSLLAVQIAGKFLALSEYRIPLHLNLLPTDEVLGVPCPQTFWDLAKERGHNDPQLRDLLAEYERLFSTGSIRSTELFGPLVDMPTSHEQIGG